MRALHVLSAGAGPTSKKPTPAAAAASSRRCTRPRCARALSRVSTLLLAAGRSWTAPRRRTQRPSSSHCRAAQLDELVRAFRAAQPRAEVPRRPVRAGTLDRQIERCASRLDDGVAQGRRSPACRARRSIAAGAASDSVATKRPLARSRSQAPNAKRAAASSSRRARRSLVRSSGTSARLREAALGIVATRQRSGEDGPSATRNLEVRDCPRFRVARDQQNERLGLRPPRPMSNGAVRRAR